MGIDGHSYTTGIMRYLKDDLAAKKGDELPDADKWRIFGDVGGLLQQQNGFYFGVFECMFDALEEEEK